MRRMTVKEAAAELGISLSLCYALLEQRMIRHERHGLGRGKYVIPEDAISEYRARRTFGVQTTEEVADAPSKPVPMRTGIDLW